MIAIAKDLKVNEQIRVRQVRIIGADGEQVGIIDTRDALKMAREKDLDLVMVSPQAVPPVCKLLDYGRFRYEQQQSEKENRKRARTQDVKAIKYRVKIDDHDFNTKTNHVRRFLEAGHKVKVTIMFRGRERTHPELGERILERVATDLKDVGAPEGKPNMMGMDMNMLMAPKMDRGPKKDKVEGDSGNQEAAVQNADAQNADAQNSDVQNSGAAEASQPESSTPEQSNPESAVQESSTPKDEGKATVQNAEA